MNKYLTYINKQIRNHCKNSYNYLIPENEIVGLFFSLLILTESAKTKFLRSYRVYSMFYDLAASISFLFGERL